jgi:tRNA (Thr-GGU) A37 N-methylase
VVLAGSYREGLRGLEGFDYVHLIVLLDRADPPRLIVEPLLLPGSNL